MDALVKDFNKMIYQIEPSVFRLCLIAEKRENTYATLEAKYNVNRYYLWHIIKDEYYQIPARIAEKLNLVAYVPTPACPVHGIVHCYDCETQTVKPARKPAARPRPPRISIRLDDPDSAARSIAKHMETEAVVKLIEILEDRK